MPTAVKQSRHGESTTRLVKPSTNGSILSRAIPVSEIEDDYIKMVLFGAERSGKTTLACQAPKPLLLCALEPNRTGGAKSVKKVPGVTFIQIRSKSDWLKLAEELKTSNPYKTVVVDSATSLQDIVLSDLMGLEEAPVQLNWGMVSEDQYRQRSEITRECLRPFLNLPCNTIVTAKERDHRPPENRKAKQLKGFHLESWIASDLGGATVGWLHDTCDYVCRLYLDKEVVVEIDRVIVKGKEKELRTETETGKIIRRLRTMYHPNIAGGCRSADPKCVPEFIDNPDWEKIQQVINGTYTQGR